ncbi:MAG: isopenicillin N synthase family oxygenase [Bacteroidetes bacterium]|nr:isopenicillin N synthase family oxygenase [Bacteroidota bacterium]
MMFDQIPTLDLAHFTQGTAAQQAQFVADLGRAYTTIGFVAVKNHGLSDDLTRRLYDTAQQVFALPQEVKLKYEIPGLGGQRGYTGKGKEHAKGRTVGDLKEFWQVGQELPQGHVLRQDYPENVWPGEVPDFGPAAKETYRTLETTGRHMLRAIALFLELPEDFFETHVVHGNSILRAIHYFPITDPDSLESDAVRAAAHEDINLITLLMGASAEGLEVLRMDGQWIPVTAIPECLVVNVGDMLQRLTNNRLKSTTHRVVNPPREKMGTSRYSIPFFLHPQAHMSLACLESCVSAQNPKAYGDISARDYLMERLREIGLIK